MQDLLFLYGFGWPLVAYWAAEDLARHWTCYLPASKSRPMTRKLILLNVALGASVLVSMAAYIDALNLSFSSTDEKHFMRETIGILTFFFFLCAYCDAWSNKVEIARLRRAISRPCANE